MDFYYHGKIKTLGFSTCRCFGGENEFILGLVGVFFSPFCYLESFAKIGKLVI